tara:strand:- start:398 stop:862 length:465 start_codon:yes stop_codon:yes gene_type:complete
MLRHINKNIILLFTIFFVLVECQRNEIIQTHGLSYLEKREKLIFVDKSNKNDVLKIFGNPATKGMSDDHLWIYIERTRTRGKLLKLGRNYLKKNNVLVLEFNKYGVLAKKTFYDKDKMNDLKFSEKITTNDIKKENFIYGFLSSIRQKMESRKK